VILTLLIDPLSGVEIMSIIRPSKQQNIKIKDAEKISGRKAAFLALFGQISGGIGFVLVQYATSIGSAAIVNALQAAQFALLVIIAIIMKSKAKTLLGEDLKKSTIILKGLAIIIIGLGLSLIV